MALERQELTIAGQTFTVMERYEEGHELTAGEASALNQTLRENVRNNLAKKEDLSQEAVDQYATEYQFGIRTPGVGRTSDPVMAEYMRLARAKIKDLLKTQGKKADSDQINAAAKNLLERPAGQQLWELAKSRVAEAQTIASDELDSIVAGIPEKAAGEAPQHPAAV